MRQVLTLWGFILLILSACENNEKAIVPRIAQASGPDTPADTAVLQNGRPKLDFESELYQYGRFRNMPYRILVPRHYDPANKYPLHIFLHGVADRGTDNEQQLNVAASQFQVDSVRERYPAFIAFPQCPESGYWFDTTVMHTLKRLIDSLVSANAINTAKISLGGYSMGAYGTFAMVAANPGFFEAPPSPEMVMNGKRPPWRSPVGRSLREKMTVWCPVPDPKRWQRHWSKPARLCRLPYIPMPIITTPG